jgi:Spherulation-specific family 4
MNQIVKLKPKALRILNRVIGTTCVSLLAIATSTQTQALELFVPAYFYPSSNSAYWDTLIEQAQLGTPITAIVNPGSGPGTSFNSDYNTRINQFRAAGGKVLGYVPTGYGGGSVSLDSTCQPASGVAYTINDVVSCATRYNTFYTIDGILLDEFTNSTGNTELSFYRSVYSGTRAINAAWSITGNPGTSVVPEYFDTGLGVTANRIVSFEQVGANYVNYAPAPGAVGGPASRFAHIIYDVSSAAAATNFVSLAAARNVGAIYITNDNFCQGLDCTTAPKDFNPFDTLPSYFAQLAAQVREINNPVTVTVPVPASAWLLFAGLVSIAAARRKNLSLIA